MFGKVILGGVAAMLVLALASPSGRPAMAAQIEPGTPSITIVAHVIWQGREVGAQAHKLPISLKLERDGKVYDLAPTVTDEKGYFKLRVDGLDPATYKYVVKGPQFLANSGKMAIEEDSEVIEVEMDLMRTGDCNGDNVVNAFDFNILRNSFGTTEGEEGYDARADLTGDKTVNGRDFNLLRGNFGEAGEE